MCFTINLNTTRDSIEKRFEADASALSDFDFRYYFKAFNNPLLPVITSDNPGVVQLMQWGLIPRWTRDQDQAEKIRKGTYNARAETLHKKPSFRDSFNKRHCIIPICGFFEWQHAGKRKIPWYIHDRKNPFIALAGIYDLWNNAANEEIIHTFSIITVPANPLMEKIHNTKKRMPAILYDRGEKRWLGNGNNDTESGTKKLLVPYSETRLNAYTVSNLINSPDANPHSQKVIEPFQHHLNGKLF
ncbi:MAG: SOS response-associated peptidase [Bacteroidales bacterium]